MLHRSTSSNKQYYDRPKVAGFLPLFLILSFMSALVLTGCGKDTLPTEVVLTSDFLPDEVFRLEGHPCMKNEIMVYLANSENQYSEVFGSEIWSVPVGDVTLEDSYKDNILARIAQIKTMKLLAQEYEVALDEDEEASPKRKRIIWISIWIRSQTFTVNLPLQTSCTKRSRRISIPRSAMMKPGRSRLGRY